MVMRSVSHCIPNRRLRLAFLSIGARPRIQVKIEAAAVARKITHRISPVGSSFARYPVTLQVGGNGRGT
jgi:hypothetical protein